jgi:hypothetical protein
MLKTVGFPSTRTGDQTIVNGNLVIGTAGKGIDFSADPSAAGMTSELLDDYEEGTWSPIPTRDGGSLDATYTSSGTYTKIGRQVFITGIINISAIASQTGNYIIISGLPFTSPLTGFEIGGLVMKNDAITTATMTRVAFAGATLIASANAKTNFPATNDTWATGDFTFSATYYVA